MQTVVANVQVKTKYMSLYRKNNFAQGCQKFSAEVAVEIDKK